MEDSIHGNWRPIVGSQLGLNRVQAMGRSSGLVCFECSCWNRQRGSMLPPDPLSILMQTEAVPLLLALAGSLMTVYTSLHCWETDVVNDHLLWVHVSYHSTVHCSNEQVLVWEFLLCFGFGSLWLSPLFMIFEMGWMTGCLWASGVAASAFCSPVTLLSTTFACQVMSRAVVSTRRVLTGAVGAWCVGSQQLGIMCLVGMAYSMYHVSCTHCSCLEGVIPSCHG